MSNLQFRGYSIKDTAKWTEFEVRDFECVPLPARSLATLAPKLTLTLTGLWASATTRSTSRSSSAASARALPLPPLLLQLPFLS